MFIQNMYTNLLCEAAGDVIDYMPSLNLNLISLCINQLDVKAGEQ